MTTIIRAHVAHTPNNPFTDEGALETFDDGGLVFDDEGRILACGPFLDVSRRFTDALPRLEGAESVEGLLEALFTPAREESIAEVRVAGRVVWPEE